jgi:mannose-6-phosphate isomerase-like protein (cupin superfamily)
MSDFHRGTLEAMLKRTVGNDERWAVALKRGTLELGLYAPRGDDPQKPHDQDEVYLVMQGQGTLKVGGERHEFGQGDALFVPAGAEHRFETFTPDFAAWVVFYGVKGGERP